MINGFAIEVENGNNRVHNDTSSLARVVRVIRFVRHRWLSTSVTRHQNFGEPNSRPGATNVNARLIRRHILTTTTSGVRLQRVFAARLHRLVRRVNVRRHRAIRGATHRFDVAFQSQLHHFPAHDLGFTTRLIEVGGTVIVKVSSRTTNQGYLYYNSGHQGVISLPLLGRSLGRPWTRGVFRRPVTAFHPTFINSVNYRHHIVNG